MRIDLQAISKVYLLKAALNAVTVTFDSGKIHALLGENGAGKSTLAGIIAGDSLPTAGTMLLDGEKTQLRNTKEAISKGIVLVHQRPLLASSLSAKENILLGLDASPDEANLEALRNEWAPQLHLSSLVKDLGGDDRFYTALLCALLRLPRCLILDEPSALLDFEQRTKLYTSLRSLATHGTTIIVITHSTAEAVNYADDITVLHEGKLFHQYKSASEYALAHTTSNVEQFASPSKRTVHKDESPCANNECCFILEHAASRPKNRPALLDATLSVRYGEITIVTGMQESALGTLEDIVTGMSTSKCTGTVSLFSKEAIPLASGKVTARLLRKYNTAIVPSDRTFRASNPNLTVEQMLTVYCKENDTHEAALKLIAQAGVNIAPEEKAANLSGGMLQRLILAREQSLTARMYILCEPMQGLDIDAQASLCNTLVSLAAAGKAILVLGAADFPLSICSTVYSLEGGVTSLSFDKTKMQSERQGAAK